MLTKSNTLMALDNLQYALIDTADPIVALSSNDNFSEAWIEPMILAVEPLLIIVLIERDEPTAPKDNILKLDPNLQELLSEMHDPNVT
jgi:hypothetical protein